MGWQIVKNPETNNYQVYSSIVDAFMFDRELTREELTSFWKAEFGRAGEENFQRIMKGLEEGSKPYFQFTMAWDDAVMWHTHSKFHKGGAQNIDKNAKSYPETCAICNDIEKDLKEEMK